MPVVDSARQIAYRPGSGPRGASALDAAWTVSADVIAVVDRRPSCAELLGDRPRGHCQRADALGDPRWLVARGRAVAHAPEDALEDAGRAKQVEGLVPGERLDARAAGARAVRGSVCVEGGEAVRGEVELAERTRTEPRQAEVGEIAERVTERRDLPVEHGDDAWLGGVNDGVVELEVAVDDRRLVARRDGAQQPVVQRVHLGVRPVDRGAVLLEPARDLPREVVPRSAEVLEPELARVERMKPGQHLAQI